MKLKDWYKIIKAFRKAFILSFMGSYGNYVVATLIEYMDITINLLGHSPEGGEHAEYIIKKELDAFAAKRPNLEVIYPGDNA